MFATWATSAPLQVVGPSRLVRLMSHASRSGPPQLWQLPAALFAVQSTVRHALPDPVAVRHVAAPPGGDVGGIRCQPPFTIPCPGPDTTCEPSSETWALPTPTNSPRSWSYE